MNNIGQFLKIIALVFSVLLVVAGLIFLAYAGFVTSVSKGKPASTFSKEKAKKVGVFSCEYEIMPDSILMRNGDFIKFEQAWGERYWKRGGYFKSVNIPPMGETMNYRIYIKMKNIADTAYNFCQKYQGMVVRSDSSINNFPIVGSGDGQLMWEYNVKYLDERVLKIYLVKTDVFLHSKINIETLPQLADTFFTLTMK